jgi:hypothetical protein
MHGVELVLIFRVHVAKLFARRVDGIRLFGPVMNLVDDSGNLLMATGDGNGRLASQRPDKAWFGEEAVKVIEDKLNDHF